MPAPWSSFWPAAAQARISWAFSAAVTKPTQKTAEEEAAQEQKNMVFYDLPEILVNLNTTGRKSSYLKIKVALEVNDPQAVPLLDARMPRIIDNFQVYLRELRIDDLQGSEGMFRIKEELLSRVNTAVKPVKVADVLFKEMLVQ